ncbi:MAG: SCP2 sterol-binding domain-containing protein [bacterium]|nr:SCP2 sterol-binding domain-containing protein [bacterium]
MSRDAADAIELFYLERVPEHYNATLTDQRQAARDSEQGARILAEMEAVRASIVVIVAEATKKRWFAFDIERGEMVSVATPAHTPFLVLAHTAADFPALHEACGDSLLGFLGALAGLGDDMRITAQRVRSLRELAGGISLERTGAGGFGLTAWFGVAEDESLPPSIPTTSDATIRLDAETYAQLRSGRLDAQDAFLAGSVPIEGDEGLAIGLALAAMSPD